MCRTPRCRSRSSRPVSARAVKVPPCPSGPRKSRPGASRTSLPLARQAARGVRVELVELGEQLAALVVVEAVPPGHVVFLPVLAKTVPEALRRRQHDTVPPWIQRTSEIPVQAQSASEGKTSPKRQRGV